jgi:hypothetical protein
MKLPALSRSYLEINHALERIGKKPAIQDTPSERVSSLISAIPATATSAESLLKEYQTSIYSRNRANPELARMAALEIRKLSWRAWFGLYIYRFQAIGRHK